jgi:hypothetical protein
MFSLPLVAKLGTADNVIWVGPPIDGVQDDWAAINDAVQAAPGGSIVRLRYSNLPYVCDSTTIVGKSHITLDLNGNTIVSRSEYSLSTCPIIVGVQAFPPVIATLDGVVAEQATQIKMSYSGVPLAKDAYFYIESARGGRQSYRVMSVELDGVTVNLDWPVLVRLDTGSTVRRFVPVINFIVVMRGAHIKHSFYGVYADARWIYEAVVWKCLFDGTNGTLEQVDGVPATALIGFDIGGRENAIIPPMLIGTDGSNGNGAAVGIEGQRNFHLGLVRSFNIGYALWINSCWNSKIDGLNASRCHGAVLATSLDIATPANESGCHDNDFGPIYVNDVIGANGVLDLQADTVGNTFDVVDCTGSTPVFGSAAVVYGRNGTLGPKGNVFKHMSVKDIQTVFYTGFGKTCDDNVCDDLFVDGVAALCVLSNSTDEQLVKTLRGSIVPPEVGLVQLTGNARFRVESASIRDGSLVFEQNRLVTLNGATPVFCPAPWATDDSVVSLACRAAGGTSHNRPVASIVKNTTSIVGSLAGWVNGAGLASWDGVTAVADGANTAHAIIHVGAIAFIRGPGIFRATIKRTGAATWCALSMGAGANLFFDLVTGAVGTATGPGVTGSAVLNVDGSTTVEMYTDDMVDSANIYVWMCQADTALVSVMPGATFEFLALTMNGVNAVSLVAEINNSDTYAVTVG